MSRYHITEKGNPGRCTAQPGNCPLGSEGDHFESPKAAREAYEAKQDTEMAGVKKLNIADERQDIIAFVKAKDLRVGDDYEGSPITEKKVGKKWVTLATEASPKHLVELEETVAVQRSEATPEAKAADRAHYKEYEARETVDKHLAGLDKAVAEMNEHMEKYGSIRDHHYASMMQAQANKAIADQIISIAENRDVSLSEAADALRDSFKERLASGYAISTGLSRSTSVIGNAMEDAKAEAMFSFIRDSWW